jgi:hypothetical protein
MHISDGITLGSFIEDSVHYQNEQVYTLYGIIFLVLSVICAGYYYYILLLERRARGKASGP